jgi:hypothetical protein
MNEAELLFLFQQLARFQKKYVIANNPALEVVLKRILTKANEARNDVHDMYNDALSLYITAYEKYLTYKSIYNIDNIDNTRQIV